MMMELDWVDRLLSWYVQVRRPLPWRQDKNPYRIWISEVMLQQTRVETVVPYYERFLTKFPTLDDLAAATEEEVLKVWEGLGYYSRARHLHKAVKEVSAKYGSRVPERYEDFRSLPGVGDYTAGAVLSIGYDVPVPAVDGNVLRVTSRLFGIQEDVLSTKTQKRVREQLLSIMPTGRASEFNQALMELGALICKPKSPHCEKCPLQTDCVAERWGQQNELPIRKKTVSTRIDQLAVVFLQADRKWLVRKRPDRGLLANLWELPNMHFERADNDAKDWNTALRFARQIGADTLNDVEEAGTYTHVFSHLTWELKTFVGATSSFEVAPPYRWIGKDDMGELAFGQVFLRMIDDILKRGDSRGRSPRNHR